MIPFTCQSLGLVLILLLVAGCNTRPQATSPKSEENAAAPEHEDGGTTATATATFAGGCFWCMESPFEKLSGVAEVVSGYTGGKGENPTYKDYSHKGHTEAVQVHYDPSAIAYEKLLDVFWRQIDPTDTQGQFVDRGPGYRPAIYYHNEQQQRLAETSKQELAQSGRFKEPIVIEILPAVRFYPAEDYHQDFYKTNPEHYKSYRRGSGRDRFIRQHWDE